MSDTSDKKPKPIYNPDDVVEPADPTPADVAVEEPAVEKPARKPRVAKSAAQPDATTPVSKVSATDRAATPAAAAPAGSATGEVAPSGVQTPAEESTATTTTTDATDIADRTASADSQFAGREVVYVQAPIPPKLRGNRGVGTALAVLGAVVFAALYAALGFVLIAVGLARPGATFAEFVLSPEFLIPIPIFLVAFVVLVLVVNRAGWAAHVFGSLVVALVVYFGTAGIAHLLFSMSGAGVPAFSIILGSPFVVVAALAAREVAIWMGLAIAARGRRVKARNLEIVDEWEREHADVRAQYERAGATTA